MGATSGPMTGARPTSAASAGAEISAVAAVRTKVSFFIAVPFPSTNGAGASQAWCWRVRHQCQHVTTTKRATTTNMAILRRGGFALMNYGSPLFRDRGEVSPCAAHAKPNRSIIVGLRIFSAGDTGLCILRIHRREVSPCLAQAQPKRPITFRRGCFGAGGVLDMHFGL